jgi:hypothetical protein
LAPSAFIKGEGGTDVDREKVWMTEMPVGVAPKTGRHDRTTAAISAAPRRRACAAATARKGRPENKPPINVKKAVEFMRISECDYVSSILLWVKNHEHGIAS